MWVCPQVMSEKGNKLFNAPMMKNAPHSEAERAKGIRMTISSRFNASAAIPTRAKTMVNGV